MNSSVDNTISLCLPKGDAMKPLDGLLNRIGFQIDDYNSKNRSYRPVVKGLQVPVRSKIMAEKDVAIQVAAGNYQIGFCGFDWVMEHRVRFPGTPLQVIRRLGINRKTVCICSASGSGLETVNEMLAKPDFIRIVGEYPNLAENFAIKNRLKRFKIFSAWGRADAYPPEHADLAFISLIGAQKPDNLGLIRIQGHACDFESDLCLVVNRKAFHEKDLSPVLKYFQTEEP